MLQNAYFLAKIGADNSENEQHLAEILQKKLKKLATAEILQKTDVTHDDVAKDTQIVACSYRSSKFPNWNYNGL